MTKIYLVKLTYQDKSDKWITIVGQVFTNKRKALSYKRYKDAKSFNLSKNKDCWFKEYGSRIEEETICNLDWTEEAIKEEMKNLPY